MGVEVMVSGSSFLVSGLEVSTWFGFWLEVFFLVVLAKPLCFMSISLELIVMNCCWFRWGWGFGFRGFGFWFGTGVIFFEVFSKVSLGIFGVCIFWGLLLRFGVELGWWVW